jgi:hypothetical protein
MNLLFKYLTIIAISGLFACCTNNKGENGPAKDIPTKDSTTVLITKPEIYYTLDTLRDTAAVSAFRRLYSTEERKIIGALNRINPERIGLKKAYVFPDTMVTDLMYYTPFPEQFTAFDSIPKLILVSRRIQAFAIYEFGKLFRWGPSSTGKKSTPTPAGLFHTNYKAKLKISTVNGSWRMPWYFNISNRGGIGLHEYLLPGYPASHSCIRLYKEDALFIYNWADMWVLSKDETAVLKKGTPVIVYGIYEFDSIPPWRKAVSDHNLLKFTDEEKNELNSYSQKILNGQ